MCPEPCLPCPALLLAEKTPYPLLARVAPPAPPATPLHRVSPGLVRSRGGRNSVSTAVRYAGDMQKSAQVVVIGGGIIGCAAAAELAAAGADVILIERREIAYGASGRNHGLIFYPQNPLTDPLYRQSKRIYRQIADGPVDIKLDADPRNFIILAAQEEDWAPAEAEAMACRSGGVRVEKLDQQQLRQAEPNLNKDLLGGWLINDGYRLDPAALTLGLALRAKAAGAGLHTHTEAKQLICSNGRVTGVATDEGLISAEVVVDAAGPWAPKLARSIGLDLPVVSARGWLILTRPIEPVTNHLLESAGWHLLSEDPGVAETTLGAFAAKEQLARQDVGLLIQQNQGGHVLLGGSRLATVREEPEGYEVTQEIANRAVEVLPRLQQTPLAAVWSGVRPMSMDGLPLIGWMPGVQGLFVATGHGGQGVMLGGGTARLVSQMILGIKTFTDPFPFRLDREPNPPASLPVSHH